MSTEVKDITVIDGSQGEGGGQIFRTSLTLAMCLGKSVRIENIRAGRNRPGLLRQHLVCLRSAQEVCDAEVTGAELGSSSVSFVPGAVKAGEYRFAIGSAGSTALVFQTVLLPLLLADGVTERELSQVQKKCLWPEASPRQRLVKSAGPGNVMSLRVDMENVTEVFESVGERNVSAERVAGRAIRDLKCYLVAGVPVGEHLADQVVLPMALGGGGCY
jgi:RNA 3'-terminal phosphate cyclase